MKRVVVVDDDLHMLSLMALLLKDAYRVETASDGAAGLELVRHVRPDLVVLDLLMPKMHGFEVCRKIKDDPELAGTKILITSSKSYPNDVRMTKEETGADDYIVKPFEAVEFQRRAARLLEAAG